MNILAFYASEVHPMNAKLAIVLSCLLLLAGCATRPSCNSCPDVAPANDEVASSCQCTEPSCGNNSCLSAQACCKLFGNVGGYNGTRYGEGEDP